MSDDREALLLETLRAAAGQFVSGSEIADVLGVSRAAVGKRVASLRERGFDIEAVHNRGYRLAAEPDALDPRTLLGTLTTRWLGRVYFYHQRLGSTNEEVERLARDGAPTGTVVLAEEQEHGRGRHGRSWRSRAGENLTFSALLRPQFQPAQAPPVTLAAAVAVAEGVRGFVGKPPTVKWPNDLLYGGRKLCGILCELTSDERRIKHLVLGVGLNVNSSSFAPELNATSLRLERGHAVQRAPVLASVLGALERWFDRLQADGPAPVLEAWQALADWMGRRVTVRQSPQEIVEGVAVGLDERGGLRLRLDDGREQVVVAGEVTIRR